VAFTGGTFLTGTTVPENVSVVVSPVDIDPTDTTAV
jgi:hypothetical protein